MKQSSGSNKTTIQRMSGHDLLLHGAVVGHGKAKTVTFAPALSALS